MNVIWAPRAADSLHELEEYICREFGEIQRQKYIRKAKETVKKLEMFPEIGRPEPLLAHRKKPYRSLLMTHKTKLIYYIDKEKNRVVVADCWDSRREPKTASKGL